MISRQTLAQCFDRIDALLGVIDDCEESLDPLLQIAAGFTTDPAIPKATQALLPKSETELAQALALRIKKERQHRGWRQKDLAEATGIARPNIARLESGRRMPKLTTLHKIGLALGLPVEELME